MALINCHECGKQISSTAPACPGCGAPKQLSEEEENQAAIKRMASSFAGGFGAAKCAMCGTGTMQKMGAGERGSAFGSGSLLGAFTKTHRCNMCGHLT